MQCLRLERVERILKASGLESHHWTCAPKSRLRFRFKVGIAAVDARGRHTVISKRHGEALTGKADVGNCAPNRRVRHGGVRFEVGTAAVGSRKWL